MAPKSSPGPSAKKARTAAAAVGKTPPAQPLPHPTMAWMAEALCTLEKDLKTLAGEPAQDFGGICAFSPKMFKKAMTDNGEYECNVTLAQHALLRLEHTDAWPVVGSVTRLMATVFCSESGEPAAVFPHAISVRAVSATDAPELCERLHRSAYLFAFLASWAGAKKAGQEDIAAAFFATAHRVRTKYLLLPNDDVANRKKWNLAEETDSMADNGASLVGYKKTYAVVAVQKDLQARGLEHDAAAVAAWFSTVRWNSQSDALPVKEVNRHVRVHSRLSANPLIKERLDLAESRFGRRHTLAFVATLDILCGKTTVQDNTQLSTALLLWVVEGTVTLMLRGVVKADVGRETLAAKIVPKLLLVRRIALFLLGRFKYKSVPGATYLEGYEPESAGKTLFGSWAAFHRAYPVGAGLEQSAVDKMPPAAEPSSFLTKLAESQVAVLEFVASLLSCTGDIDQVVAHAVALDDKMSAESFFERRTELVRDGLFDLAEVTEKHARDTKTPEPAAGGEVDPGRKEAVTVPADQPKTPEPQPDLDEAQDKNSAVHFPLLRFSEAAQARLDSVEPARFAAMVSHAERRISPWVDIKIPQSDTAANPELIKAAPAI